MYQPPDAVELAAYLAAPACGDPKGKPVSGDFDVQIRLQQHFYTAGLAVHIALTVKAAAMTELVTLAQAGAVISACWAIIAGVGAWRREFIGKRQIELAEQVLAKFFEVKDAIAMNRSPFASSEEGSTRKRSEHESRETSALLDRGYIVYERYSTKETVFADFNTFKYRFMASFGADAELIFTDTTTILNLIFVSAQMLGTHYWQRQGRVPMEPEEGRQHLDEMQRHQKIFWDHGTDDDEVRKKLIAIQQRLDTIVKPCFQEPMSTYTWLTRPWS